MNVVKEDTVLVITGNERGRQGKVLKTFPKTGRILVEGVNLIKRHTRHALALSSALAGLEVGIGSAGVIG